eukprot:2593921-Pyramimonas_sp.AAC.1
MRFPIIDDDTSEDGGDGGVNGGAGVDDGSDVIGNGLSDNELDRNKKNNVRVPYNNRPVPPSGVLKPSGGQVSVPPPFPP